LLLSRERRDADGLAGLEAGIRLRAAAVDAYLAGAEQLLKPAEGQFRVMLAEPAVEAHTGFVFFDGVRFNLILHCYVARFGSG
jgi:hypothetical protein